MVKGRMARLVYSGILVAAMLLLPAVWGGGSVSAYSDNYTDNVTGSSFQPSELPPVPPSEEPPDEEPPDEEPVIEQVPLSGELEEVPPEDNTGGGCGGCSQGGYGGGGDEEADGKGGGGDGCYGCCCPPVCSKSQVMSYTPPAPPVPPLPPESLDPLLVNVRTVQTNTRDLLMGGPLGVGLGVTGGGGGGGFGR